MITMDVLLTIVNSKQKAFAPQIVEAILRDVVGDKLSTMLGDITNSILQTNGGLIPHTDKEANATRTYISFQFGACGKNAILANNMMKKLQQKESYLKNQKCEKRLRIASASQANERGCATKKTVTTSKNKGEGMK